MAEGSYETECKRAELLGFNPPDRETFEQLDLIEVNDAVKNEIVNADDFKKINAVGEPLNSSDDAIALNTTLDVLEAMNDTEMEANLQAMRKTNAELQEKVKVRIDKLDNLAKKSEATSHAMNQHNQMRMTD